MTELSLRLPFHLRPSSLIVLTGPVPDLRAEVMEDLWRSAMGLGRSTLPLFDRLPVFTSVRGRAHLEQVVVPALATGRSVFLDADVWSGEVQASMVAVVAGAAIGDEVELQGHRGQITFGLFQALTARGLFAASPAGLA